MFRKGGPIGPSAFALPSGTVIMTDELVDLVDQKGELEALFAHKIAHVTNRHGLRSALQDSGVFLLISVGWGHQLSDVFGGIHSNFVDRVRLFQKI